MKKIYGYDDCSICGGGVEEKLVEKISTRKGRIVAVIKDVPAGICVQCGERYYRGEVIEHLEEVLAHINTARNNITIPIAEYAA